MKEAQSVFYELYKCLVIAFNVFYIGKKLNKLALRTKTTEFVLQEVRQICPALGLVCLLSRPVRFTHNPPRRHKMEEGNSCRRTMFWQ